MVWSSLAFLMETDYLIPFFEGTWSLISNMSDLIMERQTMNVSQKNKYIFGKWKESPAFLSCHTLNWEPFRRDHRIIPNARPQSDGLKQIIYLAVEPVCKSSCCCLIVFVWFGLRRWVQLLWNLKQAGGNCRITIYLLGTGRGSECLLEEYGDVEIHGWTGILVQGKQRSGPKTLRSFPFF